MNDTIKNAVENYQCSGCTNGSDISCYEKGYNQECGKHSAGTFIGGQGRIFLGMPRGFNRAGPASENVKIYIFEKWEDSWSGDKFNVPVWKHLDDQGNVLIRGISPRINLPYYHIILEDCMDKVECIEITKEDMEDMD